MGLDHRREGKQRQHNQNGGPQQFVDQHNERQRLGQAQNPPDDRMAEGQPQRAADEQGGNFKDAVRQQGSGKRGGRNPQPQGRPIRRRASPH